MSFVILISTALAVSLVDLDLDMKQPSVESYRC